MNFLTLLSLVLVINCVYSHSILNTNNKDDKDLDVPGLLNKYGYPSETHYVVTPDNYILTLHRIPHGRNGPNPNGKKKVLFLMHGLLSSSADWLINGPGKALGYIMADEGYDVWMGNARGNHYSRNHTTLDPNKDAAFWHYSWHEIGVIDIPTKIDYILQETGVESIYYSGHSQGTTSFFVLTSERPEYNDKVKVYVGLAPIAFMNHMTSPLMHLLAFWDGPLEALLPMIGINEFLPKMEFLKKLASPLCGDGSLTQILCENALFAICGFSSREMNGTLFPVLMAHTPAGSATKQFLHYAQEINSGQFRQYDYGMLGNIKKYNSLLPPPYKLDQVKAPVYLIYSHNDWLAAKVDVEKLCSRLGNCKGKFLIEDSGFNHLDYMYGIHAPEYVYNKVISLMSRYD